MDLRVLPMYSNFKVVLMKNNRYKEKELLTIYLNNSF